MTQKNLIPEVLRHVPLEKYQSRYTEMLSTWEQKAFSRHFKVSVVHGPGAAVTNIRTGEVLDSIQRPFWALHQTSGLLMTAGELGKVYFSDFYHPGLDALAYSRKKFRAYSYCWAQTFDVHDFTCGFPWMRAWEVMAFEIYEKVFVAHPMLRELIQVSLGKDAADKVVVTGLPFNVDDVISRSAPEDISDVGYDICYSSRWDKEKNPDFFIALVEKNPDLKAVVCTGHTELRGTATKAVADARRLAKEGRLTIKENLTRSQYYGTLSTSAVQFNCASQDWVSFTLLEALVFGCLPVYPNARSFPSVLEYDQRFLYTPGSLEDATSHVRNWVNFLSRKDISDSEAKALADKRDSILAPHEKALDIVADTIANG